MNHPAPETWVALVYDELIPADRTEAKSHLQVCSQCRDSVERLRATLATLDQDKASLVVPRRQALAPAWLPAVRWALAASVVLAAGFLAGRASGPSRTDLQREIAAVRQELEGQFHQELKAVATTTISAASDENRRLWGEFARDLQAGQTADRRDFLAALEALDQRWALDSEILRANLVTLARRTGTGFQQTGSQLNLLASYLPAEPTSETLSNSSPDK